jgi:hypothetical protein
VSLLSGSSGVAMHWRMAEDTLMKPARPSALETAASCRYPQSVQDPRPGPRHREFALVGRPACTQSEVPPSMLMALIPRAESA